MIYEVTIDSMNNVIEQMKNARDIYNISVENIKWKLKLPITELNILYDAIEKYIIRFLKISPEEYIRRKNIVKTYGELKQFYLDLLPKYKSGHKLSYYDYSKFDINLSFDDAIKKYINLSKDEILRFKSELSTAEMKSELYVANLRNSYTGSLATLLEKEQQDYEMQGNEDNTLKNTL